MNIQFKKMNGYPKAASKDYLYVSLATGIPVFAIFFILSSFNILAIIPTLFFISIACLMVWAGWKELQVKFIKAKKEEVKLLKKSEDEDNIQGQTVAFFSQVHLTEMEKVGEYNSAVVSTFDGPLLLPNRQIATKIVPMLRLKDNLNDYKSKYPDAICISEV